MIWLWVKKKKALKLLFSSLEMVALRRFPFGIQLPFSERLSHIQRPYVGASVNRPCWAQLLWHPHPGSSWMSEQISRWLQPQYSSHLNWNPRHRGAETSPPYLIQTPGLPCAGQTPCLTPAQKSINKRCKFTWMYMVMCLMPSNLKTVSSLRSHTHGFVPSQSLK